MMRKKNRKSMIGMLAVMMFILTGCSSLDVIGNHSIKKFDEILAIDSDVIRITETEDFKELLTADGSAKLLWADQQKLMVIDSKPFVEAGLILSSLPENMVVGDQIVVESPITNYRDGISFHESLGHYGYDFGNGNAFEWAQDIENNDKDIVFVLNPKPFLNAGADVEKIEGWSFRPVETMDTDGNTLVKDKLLKPVNLD